MHTPINNTCINRSLHGDGENTVEYSRWLNVYGKLSAREKSGIKNYVMFSTSTIMTFVGFFVVFLYFKYVSFVICKEFVEYHKLPSCSLKSLKKLCHSA